LLFEEFFVNPNNVLTITTATGQTFTRFGSEDDPERGTVALYMSPGPMNLTFEQKTPTTTAIKHAGFRTILKPFNLTNDEATQCHENRYLKETYFVTSFAYPQDYGSRRNCSWTFTADDNIRQSKEVYSGTDVTSDLTVVFYYRKFVQINFTSGFESCNTSRRFSFVIDVYADPPETKERCVGDGVLYDMSNKTSVAISTMNYVTKAYTNYLDCRFSFTNPPYSHIIYLNMVFESERCCDTMIVDGIGKVRSSTFIYYLVIFLWLRDRLPKLITESWVALSVEQT
uniref:CUB domain-containing protein n=1 Tax=Toxocara canis TaxID=6265 RepID=A0A183TX56_TOXCA